MKTDPFDPLETPTRVRYGVLAFLCALSFVLYIDRVCISQAVPVIQEDLHLTNTDMSYVLSAFILAYGLFEVPTGRWGDKYGSRGVLVRIVLWWSAFTALTGCVPYIAWQGGVLSLGLMVLVRFLFGAGEAGALPNAVRVVARWFPAGRRGAVQGLVATSTLVGGAATPSLAALLIGTVGWRWSFVLFGALGVVWAALFWRWFRDEPADHPGVNGAELRLIGPGSRGGDSHPPVPWRYVLTSANVWLLGLIVTCAAFTTYLFFSWYPKYLQSARGLDNFWSGLMASLVLAGGAVGVMGGGLLCDALTKRIGPRARRFIGFGAIASASLLLYASVLCDEPLAAAGVTAVASFVLHFQTASWWGTVTVISGRHLGALFGLMNSLGVPGAFVSPIFMGYFTDRREALGHTGRDQWDPAFAVYSAVLAVGAAAWLFVNESKSVVGEPADGPPPATP